jgi:hypothetical protein
LLGTKGYVVVVVVKLGISKGSFHNGVFASACREDRFLTEDAIRKYHCTKFTTLMLAA